MELLDPEDGLPIWDAAEGTELPGEVMAIERLGTGRRCETWLVWSVALWSPAVLKLARPHQLSQAVKSLRREATVLSGNLHPALPRLLADGTSAPVPHVLTEYIDGPSLADELDDNGALTPCETALLGAQVLAAVLSLHRRGLAHLDLKPDNLVLRDSRPILIDFGSTRSIGSLQPAGHPVGTVGYAPPEQESCQPVAATMDLYALGQTLRECLDDAPAGDSAVQEVLQQSTAANPEARGAASEVLVSLAEAAGETRPWPGWLDRFAKCSAGGERTSAAAVRL